MGTAWKNLIIGVLLVLLSKSAAGGGSGFLMIVHPDNPMGPLSLDVASDIFLKKRVEWDSGEPIDVVDQSENSRVRGIFTRQVHGRSVSAVKSYWHKRIFAGRGVPPVEMSTDEAVMSFVRRNPLAIGYVSASTPTSGLKTIRIHD